MSVALVVLSACDDGGSGTKTTRQAQVEARGDTVMPFDQEKTTHVFHETPRGGVQQVVANDPHDEAQIRLIRGHLRKEATRFSAGDFADPMEIHGMQMPGIAVLRRGAERVHVVYSATSRGAQIVYDTPEPRLVAALHEWFDAQLMDHGTHAHG
jgi:hypothetical protein